MIRNPKNYRQKQKRIFEDKPYYIQKNLRNKRQEFLSREEAKKKTEDLEEIRCLEAV